MKTLIQRQLYRPAVVLPLMGLARLLVVTDFSLTQVAFILILRGARAIVLLISLPLSKRTRHVPKECRTATHCSVPSLQCGH